MRIGIHSGALIAGISGNSFDIWGDAVNIAARLKAAVILAKFTYQRKPGLS
ncbi:MAG: hypothetical protein CM1200mP28_18230 [Deltaproteobacteria bacterium]|nr:MAG: hypothetical protein CM1200mP28_18230 [Deltaproteobacteria bacterium]